MMMGRFETDAAAGKTNERTFVVDLESLSLVGGELLHWVGRWLLGRHDDGVQIFRNAVWE